MEYSELGAWQPRLSAYLQFLFVLSLFLFFRFGGLKKQTTGGELPLARRGLEPAQSL
jgi:hypothetical protein